MSLKTQDLAAVQRISVCKPRLTQLEILCEDLQTIKWGVEFIGLYVIVPLEGDKFNPVAMCCAALTWKATISSQSKIGKITCLEVNGEALRFSAFIRWPFLLLLGLAENNRLLSGTSQMDDTQKK